MTKPVLKRRFISRVPNALWIGVGIAGLLGYFSVNPALSVSAALLLVWFFLLLWRTGEPPILLLALGFQWMQVAAKVIHADILGVPVQTLSAFGGDLELAIWLSMAALALLALGMRIALIGLPAANPSVAHDQARQFSIQRLWMMYLLSLPASLFIMAMAWAIPGGTQVALALANMRWVAFFALAYVCLLKMQRLHLLLIAVAIEFVLGVGGYFADFKTVFFVGIIAFVAAGRRLTVSQVAVVLGLASLLFTISLVWTAVKIDYRDYLSGGQSAQIVTRGYVERTQKLFEMVSELTKEDMSEAVTTMVERISYVDFFAVVTTTVPRRIDYENGALWGGALQHIFMPRLFFPSKPPLPNDSERTNYYTGLYMAGEAQGTSVSMGYVAESYIDFGKFGMFAPILALGMLLGWFYRFFLTRKNIPIFMGYGLAVTVLLEAYRFETAAVKFLGAIVTAFLVAYVLQKFLVRKLARRLVVRRRNQGIRPLVRS
jgi:hypothetical protein